MRTLPLAPALMLALMLACDPPIDIEEPAPECEGLDLEACLLPWPSSRYLVSDPGTSTGYRVALPPEAMPSNVVEVPVDPAPWNRWDGFSAMTSAIAQLPVRIDASNLVDFRHVERSLDDASPTILLDVTTGERVAHFAELETAAGADPSRSTIYVRPAARLTEGHRYVVALRALRSAGGGEVPLSAAFRALRDGRATTSERLEARRAAFERDVLAPLVRAGVRRESLVLAWDFVTASGSSGWGDLRAMRDDAVARAGSAGLGCTVTEVTEDPSDPHVWRRIEGTYSVPSYLDADGRLARDASGAPRSTGEVEAPFTVIVPRSAQGEPAPGTRLVIFGHGLLSSRQEMMQAFLLEQADRDRMILAGTDLIGLATGDEAALVPALIDLNGFSAVMDRIAQSLVAQLLLPRAIAGRCSDEPAFRDSNIPFVDGSRRYYYGLSQGGNFGPTFAALSDDVDRFVMGVGGISFPIQITRSVHLPRLEEVLAAGYPSRIDRDLLMVMFAHH
ncbi:MAG: hypothetical protein K8H88_09910, partial [Sandaracinaceae bacterium]|nr:hypothetical protein [Sandaracinaceae bacterium]